MTGKTSTKASRRRVVGHASVMYFGTPQPLTGVSPTVTAHRGDVVELLPLEEARLDELGALMPKGASSEDARGELADAVAALHAERSGPGLADDVEEAA